MGINEHMLLTPKRLKFIFSKHRGNNGLLKTWEEFDSDGQKAALRGVNLDPDEVPVIGMADGRCPAVITAKRIIWHSSGMPHSLELSAISQIRVPEFFHSSKSDLHQLWLVTKDGDERLIDMEPGAPFFVLWNLLLQIIGRVAGQLP